MKEGEHLTVPDFDDIYADSDVGTQDQHLYVFYTSRSIRFLISFLLTFILICHYAFPFTSFTASLPTEYKSLKARELVIPKSGFGRL